MIWFKIVGLVFVVVGILIFLFQRAFVKFLIACWKIGKIRKLSLFWVKEYDEKSNNGKIAIWFLGLYFIGVGLYLTFFA